MIRKGMIVALLALALVACGGSKKVGTGLKGDFSGIGGDLRSSFGPSETASARPSGEPSRHASAVPTTKATATGPVIAFTIKITGDGFDPPTTVTVAVNSYVKFVNEDNVAHSVRADNEDQIQSGLDSGPVAPGRSWIYHATKVGTIAYSDPDRPFATGNLRVYR